MPIDISNAIGIFADAVPKTIGTLERKFLAHGSQLHTCDARRGVLRHSVAIFVIDEDSDADGDLRGNIEIELCRPCAVAAADRLLDFARDFTREGNGRHGSSKEAQPAGIDG